MCGNLFQMSQREGFGFHFVIVYGSSAVSIHKTDILRGCPCFLHGLADGEIESVSRAGRTGDVVGIVTDGSSRRITCSSVPSELSNTAPQASPKFNPSRLLSYGRHGRELRDRKDPKPLVMK